jgi:hypothetical protein
VQCDDCPLRCDAQDRRRRRHRCHGGNINQGESPTARRLATEDVEIMRFSLAGDRRHHTRSDERRYHVPTLSNEGVCTPRVTVADSRDIRSRCHNTWLIAGNSHHTPAPAFAKHALAGHLDGRCRFCGTVLSHYSTTWVASSAARECSTIRRTLTRYWKYMPEKYNST